MARIKPKRTESLPALPHARIGHIVGLLEVMRETEGPDDIYKLARKLGFELDDLLPITEAAEMLGFAKIESGDIDTTPLGIEMVDGDENLKKEIFRKQVQSVPLIRRIVETLRNDKDHRVEREFFTAMLQHHFSPSESERQLATALDWGRYAELFEYEPDAAELFLPGADEEM